MAKPRCRFNANPNKIPTTFFREIEKTSQNLYQITRDPQRAKAILSKKSNSGEIALGFRVSYTDI